MAIVKNEVFISLLHENFYIVEKELTFGGGRNCSRCRVNEQIFREWEDSPYPPVGKTLYSYPNIEANIFDARFLKRAAKLGSSFLAIYLL